MFKKKYIFIFILLLYLGLFFVYRNGYYEKKREEDMLLTEAMIKEYEEDLQKGVDVSSKKYLNIKPQYNNIYTQETLKVSKKIERLFDRIIKYFFNKVSNSINDEKK